jgi:2-polyprenyl-6-methoxyphenol hydroxylase-like FAD-dependent oxidoreductase
MNMESLEQVVVVGAGPVGLWLACELQLAGVSTVVLERAGERSPHSKALGLHIRTVEVFAMRGRELDFVDSGPRAPSWHFGILASRLDFSGLDTPFPYMTVMPQVRTEELLEKYATSLGVRILRGHTVTGVTQDESSVSVEVNGTQVVRARFLVGCDGAGSTVRKSGGIEFPGTDADQWAYLGDVVLDDPPAPGPHTLYTSTGMVILAPLPGGRHRVTGFDPTRQQVRGTELTLEELRASTIQVAGTDYGMRDPVWLSRFGNATRQAATYRKGRILVAGDAAHMHLPAGGLGLNVGIQDAMNLGWKLAAVLQDRASDALLDTYHAERHPVGTALLENTRAQAALLTSFTEETQALRALLSRMIARQPEFARDLAEQQTALDVAYPSPDPRAHPLTGTRAPDLGGTLFSRLHDGHPVVLENITDDRPQWSQVRSAIIRPDGHVWWASDSATPDADTLSRLFRPDPA